MNMQISKIVKYAVTTIRDEEENIESWAFQMRCLAENVYILLDPETSDNTEKVVKEKCPFVHIEYQNRSLGNADEENLGDDLIMHVNKSKWINENVKEGEWFIQMGCDERYDPVDLIKLENEITFAFRNNFDCLTHTIMIEPVPVSMRNLVIERHNSDRFNQHYVKPLRNKHDDFNMMYCVDWKNITQTRFFKKSKDWSQNNSPHSGFSDRGNMLYSTVPLYHFHRIKYNKIFPSSWRDARGNLIATIKKNFGKLPIIARAINFKDWRWME